MGIQQRRGILTCPGIRAKPEISKRRFCGSVRSVIIALLQ